jgi:hypothetical protein
MRRRREYAVNAGMLEDRALTMGTLLYYYYQGAYCCHYWYYFSTTRQPIVLA